MISKLVRLLAFLALAWFPVDLNAQANMEFEPDFAGYHWTEFYAPPGFGAVDMAVLPNGNLVIAQKHGLIRVISQGGVLSHTMLDIREMMAQPPQPLFPPSRIYSRMMLTIMSA